MSKLPKFLLIFTLLSVGLVAVLLGVPFLFDESTASVLGAYERTKNAEAVRIHLLKYRGEAEGSETRIEFVSWGIEHPDEFIEIVEGIEPPHKSRFCKNIAHAVYDIGTADEFESAFADRDSECLRIVRSAVSSLSKR